jgi:type IV secretory pathway VirB4 component
MFIYPTDGKEVLDDLRRKITEMEAELSTDIQRGRLVNPATQAKLEDALNLQANLVKGEERFFQFGLYITINAESVEELDRTNKNLEAALGSLLIISKKATLQMEDGFVTTLPISQDKLAISRNMDTTSLATTFPFVSSDLSDDKGIMYGVNMHNGSLVIFDRFSMQNYNSVVFATAGAGKSYMIKLEVLRSVMLGTEIIVIDPENEYRDLAMAVGGQYIAFGYGEASKINPFDLSLVEEEGENALNSKILGVHKLLKVMLGAMDPIEESIMDKAMMEAYKMKGITPDPATQNREPPLIEDLYKSLIGMEDEKAKSLAARLEKYIKGSFAGIFNQKTTVNLNNQFVVFGIKNLEESLRPVAMHIILDYIWTIVKKTLKKRILVVDEAWYLMQFEDSASFLRGIVKRGRKYYLGVTTITQDVDDFLATPYGKEIVTNSSIQILLKQHTAAIDQIGEVFYLSEGEKQLLLTADKGQGIFFAGQNHVAIQVISSEDEHKLITSNPEDVLKKQAVNKMVNVEKPKEVPRVPQTPQTQAKQPFMTPTSQPVINKPMEFKNDLPKVEPAKIEIKPQGQPEVIVDVLQRKIGELEDKEKQELDQHELNSQKLIEEIPIKNQELPPLPKFEPPKPEVINMEETKKPIFVKTEEIKVPQPPQFIKKPQPIFDSNTSKPPLDKGDLKKPEDTNKMDYDKLFGNGIV